MNDIWCEYCKRFFGPGWHSCVRYCGDGTQHPRKRNEADFHDGYEAGYNDAIEQVAKWMDKVNDHGYDAFELDPDDTAARVRSMKKQ